MKKVVHLLKALANENRLKLLYTINRHKDLSISELSNLTKIHYKTTSNHVRKLAAAGIIKLSKDKNKVRGNVKKIAKDILQYINAVDRRK